MWMSLMLAITYNVALSYALRLNVAVHGVLLKRCRWFQGVAILGIILFDGSALTAFFSDMGIGRAFMILPVCGVLGLTLLPFLLFLYGEAIDAARRAAMSEDNIKVERTFDQVDAAIAQRDYARAETKLREAIEEDPRAPEPHRRLADVLLARGDLAACVRELRQAAALTREAEPKTVILFRIADLLAEKGNDPEGAKATLKGVVYEFPETKYAAMAQARLDRLGLRERPPVG